MRFAKVPERVLEILPARLVARYAWLAMSADYQTGVVRVRSWSEAAAVMRCGERAAQRALAEMQRVGAIEGNPPISIQIVVNDVVNDVTNDVVSDITPSIQTIQKRLPGVITLWEDFCEGRRGQRRSFDAAPRKFAEAVRASGIGESQLREVCRLAGESYSDWDGAVNFENALSRGLERMSRGDTAAEDVDASAWEHIPGEN